MSTRALWRGSMMLLALAASPALAQYAPSKPVEFVIHGGPGSGGDTSALFIASIMEQEKLVPVRVQVVHKTGGGGAVAMAYMAQKKGADNVIALFSPLWITGGMINEEWRVDFNELTPIARLVLDPAMIVVKANSPYTTLGDFISAAKKEPGQLKQSGGSPYARDNVVRLLLQKATGASWLYVPFQAGAQRLVALLGGHVQLYVADAQEVKEHIRSKAVRPLAIVGEARLPDYPDVPTLDEAARAAGFRVPPPRSMRGVVGPPAMPKEAVQYWESVFERLTKTSAWRKYLADGSMEDGFEKGAALSKSAAEYREQQRRILTDAEVKLHR